MMDTQHSAQFLRKRKLMLVLPLLVLPFITLAFWSLGGGKGEIENRDLASAHSGLNLDLPEASFKEEKTPMDKLKFYELADKDSSRLQKLMKQDPYYSMTYVKDSNHFSASFPVAGTSPFTPSFTEQSLTKYSRNINKPKYSDPNEEKVMKKLAALSKAMEEQETIPPKNVQTLPAIYEDKESDRLMTMIEQLSTSEQEKDPELTQLDKMLDKIIAIQNPGQSQQPTKEDETTVEAGYLPVHRTPLSKNISLLEPVIQDSFQVPIPPENTASFYGLSDDTAETMNDSETIRGTSISAVVHENQTLMNGATIKLRLTDDLHIGSHTIPAGQFVYGSASLNNERLLVEINSVRNTNSILQVKLKLYDMDGIEGIYIPGSIERDVTKQAGGNALQSIDLMNTLNPSLSMQAASLGIQTAKSLLSKKVKLVKVQVKAGYQVLLKEQSR